MIPHSRTALAAFGLWLTSVSVLSAQTITPTYHPAVPGKLDVQTQRGAGVVVAHNQQVANAVAARLRQEQILKGYRIEILFRDGRLVLNGHVGDAAQRAAAEKTAATVAGVKSVVNQLQIASGNDQNLASDGVVQTQVLQPPPIEGPPVEFEKKDGPKDEVVPVPPGGPAPQEPAPIFQAHPPGAAPNAHYPPRMPPYAWPTYAPYNNFSRVAYPTAYPYQSWPFIGPMYPFPKVPLGWRSVSLTWQDGFWWYGRNATGYHWWQTRFW